MEFLNGMVGFLVPHLPWLLGLGQKAVEKGAETVGTQGAQRLWNRLFPVLKDKAEVLEVAKEAAENPQDGDTVAALRYQLKKVLMAPEHGELVAELGKIWAEMGTTPGVQVSQVTIGDGNQVIGVVQGGSVTHQGWSGSGRSLGREKVLEILRDHKAELVRQYGIVSLGIFGSVARDEARSGSDVDVVVTLEDPNLFALVRLREDLRDLLGCEVDVVHDHEELRPFLRRRIEQEGITV